METCLTTLSLKAGVDNDQRVIVAKSTLITTSKFLGYQLKWCGIFLLTKLVEALLAIDSPKIVSTLDWYLCMVHYSQDIWEKKNKLLTPLIYLVEGQQGPKMKDFLPFVWMSEHHLKLRSHIIQCLYPQILAKSSNFKLYSIAAWS